MERVLIEGGEAGLDFNRAKRLADALAEERVDGPLLLSWYDRGRDLESPAGVNECHRHCATPGYVAYAENRGGTLLVDVAHGAYVFCYRPLGEFA
ncbi:MAG: AF1514 family protein [Pseudomonadota bacterium]